MANSNTTLVKVKLPTRAAFRPLIPIQIQLLLKLNPTTFTGIAVATSIQIQLLLKLNYLR